MNPGRLEVVRGCMLAGKTTRLIERLLHAQARGLRVVAFKHRLDQRYARDALMTHDARRFPAIAVASAEEVAHAAGDAGVIAIDEAQFFGPSLIECCEALRALGRHAVVAGIDFDAWGRPFEPLPSLAALADVVETRTAPCTACGRPARYSQRITRVVDGDLVGGPGDFAPRCRSCFVPLDRAAPAPRPEPAGGLGPRSAPP